MVIEMIRLRRTIRWVIAAAVASPLQKSRTVSRNLSFHSAHPGGNAPTWYPPGPQSHGSAISLTVAQQRDPGEQAFRKPLLIVKAIWFAGQNGS